MIDPRFVIGLFVLGARILGLPDREQSQQAPIDLRESLEIPRASTHRAPANGGMGIDMPLRHRGKEHRPIPK
jgi:hypothetical protein